MGTTSTTPTEPITAPAPTPPTPLDPPVMYHNLKWTVPDIMVTTQQQADALDPTEWAPMPPTTSSATKDQYPKLYANVNMPPKIAGDAKEAASFGDSWKEFKLPQALVTAAQANLDAAAANPPV